MGKRIIIKGADFSQNGIPSVATRVFGVTTSNAAQYVDLNLPSGLTSSAAIKLDFLITQTLAVGNECYYLGNTYNNRSHMEITNTDGRIRAYCNNKYATASQSPWNTSPTLNEKHSLYVSETITKYDNVTKDTSSGTAHSPVDISVIRLFVTNIGTFSFVTNIVAGAFVVCGFKVYSSDGTTLLADFVAAKDSNNKACFWNVITDELFYANSGDLVVVNNP